MNRFYYIWLWFGSKMGWIDAYRYLKVGENLGWISKPYCMTHEGNYDYMSEEEREEWDEGGDPCHIAISVL